MRVGAAVGTATTLLLALGLAACGPAPIAGPGPGPGPGSGPSIPPVEVVTRPTSVTVTLDRATFVPAMNAAQAKQKSWRLFMLMRSGGQTVVSIRGQQTARPAATSMEITGTAFDGRTARFVVIGETGYASVPGTTPDGKFVKFTPGQVEQLDRLIELGDPTKIFKTFEKSVLDARFVGAETIIGESLERYRVLADSAKVFAAQGKPLPAGLPATIEYSIWMDKSHLVHRMEFEVNGTTAALAMTDYNQPVTITPPPAGEIAK